jgi:hypothetical protein
VPRIEVPEVIPVVEGVERKVENQFGNASQELFQNGMFTAAIRFGQRRKKRPFLCYNKSVAKRP